MNTSEKMKFAVIGAGGVGGYFGGKLAQAGHPVTFIARGTTLKAIRSGGLRVDSLKGDFHIYPTAVTADPMEVGPVDVILVAVKAWQVANVAPTIHPMMGPNTLVIPLQNGVEARDTLASFIDAASVIGGFCRIFSRIVAPGHIQHFAIEPTVLVGEWQGGNSERIDRLVHTMQAADISTNESDDIQAKLWEKFLLITPMSGIGAITRVPVGEYRKHEETRAMLTEAMTEVVRVGRGLGVTFSENAVERTMGFIDNLPADATASMQRDLMEGRPSELEFQNGAVVRLGKKAGIAVPLNTFIYHALLPMERRTRSS